VQQLAAESAAAATAGNGTDDTRLASIDSVTTKDHSNRIDVLMAV